AKDSGKSTLLRCLHFIEEKEEGEIWLEGVKLQEPHVHVSLIHKHVNLFPHKTIIENVVEALKVKQKQTMEDATFKGKRLLNKVGLEERAYVYPRNLTRFEIKRVAI